LHCVVTTSYYGKGTNDGKNDRFLKAMEEMIERQIGSLKAELRTLQEKMDSLHERMMAKLNRHQEKLEACLGKTETYPEMMKTNSEEMESGVEHWEVPKEETAVKSSAALKKQHRVWQLAAGRRGEPKERTRGNCGSRNKLAAGRKIPPPVQEWHGARYTSGRIR
jgi:hypothetical protein